MNSGGGGDYCYNIEKFYPSVQTDLLSALMGLAAKRHVPGVDSPAVNILALTFQLVREPRYQFDHIGNAVKDINEGFKWYADVL